MEYFKVKITKRYNKAIRVETQKGFNLNLPICKSVFISQDGFWATVEKKFFLMKKNQALKDYEHWKFKQQEKSIGRNV